MNTLYTYKTIFTKSVYLQWKMPGGLHMMTFLNKKLLTEIKYEIELTKLIVFYFLTKICKVVKSQKFTYFNFNDYQILTIM